MSSLLERFRKDSVGSANRVSDYVQKIGSRGDFRKIYGINAILNSWNNILLTPKRSYPNNPEYGSDLYKLVFEPLDEETVERIISEVAGTLSLYDDRATISDINVYRIQGEKGFTVDVIVDYEGSTDTLSVVITEQAFSGLLTVED